MSARDSNWAVSCNQGADKVFPTEEKARHYAAKILENEGYSPRVWRLNVEGTWAYAPNGKQIFVPDERIRRSARHFYALPLRGSAHTMAIWHGDQKRFVGWVLAEDLGFADVKEFMKSSMYSSKELKEFV
jgi:hypothetical protein